MKKSHLKARIIRPIVMSLFAVFLALTIMPNVSHAASPIGGSDSTLTIRKTSVGVETPDDAQFTISGPGGFTATFKYSDLKLDGTIEKGLPHGTYSVYDEVYLPAGTYSITENNADVEGYALTLVGNTTVKVVEGQNAEINLTNQYTPVGNLKLTKTSTGAQTPDHTVFTINGPDDYTNTLKYSDLKNGTITLENLKVGTYTVTESNGDVKGYTLTIDGTKSAKVTQGNTAEINLVNRYSPTTVKTNKTNPSNTNKTVEKAANQRRTSPQTGDSTNTVAWLILCTGAALILALMMRQKNVKNSDFEKH